jgi:energy-coupling factor transporter ATP-binding protein EcfA2
MSIVNLRGTSGSGKSTLVKAIFALATNVTPIKVEGRKQPLGYTMEIGAVKLFVPGHYETACGGSDTVSKYMPGIVTPRILDGEEPNSYHLTFGLVRKYVADGYSVLFEGLLISGDVRHTKALLTDGLPINVVAFDLPIELCISSINARRAAKGNTEPVDEKNTRDKHRLLGNCVKKLSAAGVPVFTPKTREDALVDVKRLLGLQ